jgi:SAM-dependent methyltransferase
MIKMVGGYSAADYEQIGQHFLEIFRTHGGLMAADRVLDVGCGCGRMAMALVGYLETGRYEGFDVLPALVAWCQRHITPQHPAFRFQHADLYNKTYNPRGTVQAKDFRFPYPDGSFDFTFLTSVFTHMLPEDVGQYAREIARTLAPRGRGVLTFFLLNEDSRQLQVLPGAKIAMRKSYLGGQVQVLKWWKPEAAVAYPEETARRILEESGLRVREVLYGNWCGREDTVSFQDVIVVEKG